MSELRIDILKQELQKELELAKKLDAEGKQGKAAEHYKRAANLSRKLGFLQPPSKAKETFSSAQQYERVAGTIASAPNADKAEEMGVIDNLIVSEKPDTEWEDIGNLEEAKISIKEAIILPFIKQKPGFVTSTKSILLYGPPGTGKTLLAKASSNTLKATFFEAKASALLSKYYGESGKLINALFSKAKEMQPSLIFMDEIDSIALSRDDDIHEATRRVVGELLTQLEGFSSKKEDKLIFIGATNKPWSLDDAMLSRFQRKVYVPLPDSHARRLIFNIHLKNAELDISMDELAAKTERFSGRDIANLCREAIANMIREQNPNLQDLSQGQIEKYSLKYRKLTQSDFEKALGKIKPIVTEKDLQKFDVWAKEFGS